jgi:hypothetical protein
MASIISAGTTDATSLNVSSDKTGILQLASNNAVTAVTIDASQNVGIGTSSPSTKLAVAGGIAGTGAMSISGGGWGVLPYVASSLVIDNNAGQTRFFADGDASNFGSYIWYGGKTTGATSTYMSIDTSGYVSIPVGINATGGYATIAGVGATNTMNGGPGTGAWALGIQQNTTSGGGGRVLGLRNVTDFNNASNEVIYYQGNATARFYVLSNGGIYNYSGNNSNLSDRREKTNFAPSKSYLDTVCAIPVQTFNYIDQNMEEDGGLTLGVVAQDVQAVAPELVKESNWGTQDEPKMRLSIYQTDLQFALMKSIQELKAINDTQAETINALTARIVALEGQ